MLVAFWYGLPKKNKTNKYRMYELATNVLVIQLSKIWSKYIQNEDCLGETKSKKLNKHSVWWFNIQIKIMEGNTSWTIYAFTSLFIDFIYWSIIITVFSWMYILIDEKLKKKEWRMLIISRNFIQSLSYTEFNFFFTLKVVWSSFFKYIEFYFFRAK